MKILIVEDDKKLARFLSRVLVEEGYTVDLCANGENALAQCQSGIYDLIVLDWMLPAADGLSVCRDLRRAGNLSPILMLTARAEIKERIMGLEAGADDYLSKPFEVEELIWRIRALLRRSTGFAMLKCGGLEIDRLSRRVLLEGKPLELTNREYALLLHLAHRLDQVVPRSDLLVRVFDTTFDTGSNLVEVHMSRLRDKLGKQAWIIETVRGVGYRLRSRRTS